MRCSGRESILPLNKVTIPFISNSLPNHLLLKVVYFKNHQGMVDHQSLGYYFSNHPSNYYPSPCFLLPPQF